MKTLTRKELIKRCDRLRQTYARYDGAKKKKGQWVNTCVTCGAELPCNKTNGGHFIPRACYPLRWDEKNVHCQCVRCNLYKNGAYIEYSLWFSKTYGFETFNKYTELYKQWQTGKIKTTKMDELKLIYDDLLKKGRALEKKVGEQLFPKTWEPFGPEYLEEV